MNRPLLSPGLGRWTRVVTAAAVLAGMAHPVAAQPGPAATFRSAVDLVSVGAVVRDQKGRLVRRLTREDFQVIDGGEPRRIMEFWVDDTAPVSIAVVVDVSGSMRLGPGLEGAQLVVNHLLSWLTAEQDQAALFVFDHQLRQVQFFTCETARLREPVSRLTPFGTTSLFDAIGETAKLVAREEGGRRAIVVVTDGIDTSSRLSLAEVSGIASSIDVPVYLLNMVSPIDAGRVLKVLAGATEAGDRYGTTLGLLNLARWTGGELYVVGAPADASMAARQIVDDLRHQYVMAFEPGGQPGWHPLIVRTLNQHLTVRARGGYLFSRSKPIE